MAWPSLPPSALFRGGAPAPEVTPLDLLSNVLIWIRPDADQVVLNGANAAEIVNRGSLGGSADAPTVAEEALWNAADANFNGKPTVTLDGVSHYYNLPDLSALTEGEAFLVGRKRIDPGTVASKSGLWKIYTSTINSHLPYPDGIIYDCFGITSNYYTLSSNPRPNMAVPFVYNPSAAPNAWSARLNGADFYSTSGTVVGFNSDPRFGKSQDNYFYDGEMAELVICGTVQTPEARAAYLAYLSRFGFSL